MRTLNGLGEAIEDGSAFLNKVIQRDPLLPETDYNDGLQYINGSQKAQEVLLQLLEESTNNGTSQFKFKLSRAYHYKDRRKGNLFIVHLLVDRNSRHPHIFLHFNSKGEFVEVSFA
ncbi:hypothetical protein KA119_02110 [Candidatus Gracilibacteria bacterium]|nr:hypothetical protein [Candidatus Gracilibacteria bacterium]